jgi:hypothetical protein
MGDAAAKKRKYDDERDAHRLLERDRSDQDGRG